MPASWLKLATMTASRIGFRYFFWKNGSSAETVSSCSDSAISATRAAASSLPTCRSTSVASSRRCCLTSQRGLSGIRRTKT